MESCTKDGKMLIELRKREEMAELQAYSFILVFLFVCGQIK